ncbi:NADH-quinone oxidoreductase subunit NuoK [Candidatus Neomarinimicrobiota bacterium]
MVVPLYHILAFSGLLFTIGVLGVLFRRNAIIVFMSIEIMLNAVNLAFIAFSRFHGNVDGQVFVFFIMTLAAAEVAVGLAIIISLFRNLRTSDITEVRMLKN